MTSKIREGVMLVAGLALVGASPRCAARSFSASQPDEQSTQGRVPAAIEKAPLVQKSQGGEAVAAPAQAKPPLVTYQDGELTIVAENATLSEVLAAVRAAMGADIDLPGGGAEQRIWVHLGPGPARTVLRDLLDGTEFNYVIQASESDSDGIRSVLLSPRSKNPESGNTGTQVARGQDRYGQSARASLTEVSEPEAAVGATPATTPPTPTVAAADTGSSQPEMLPAAPSVQSAAGNSRVTQGGTEPITIAPGGSSEQMMQQLQSMYEQRRQMQMQQNQGQKPQASN